MSKIPPRCIKCIFVVINSYGNILPECNNPVSNCYCYDEGNCFYHMTNQELTDIYKDRLKNKLNGELTNKVIDKIKLSDTCEFYDSKTTGYTNCSNLDWHHNGTYRCSCHGMKSECKFWNKKMLTPPSRCKHISDSGICRKSFGCPMVPL